MKRKSVIIAAIAVLLIAVLAFSGCKAKTKTVTIIDNGKSQTVTISAKATVQEAISEAGLKLNTGDQVSVDVHSVPVDGAEIKIERIVKVKIIKDKNEYEVELIGATVEDALKEAGVKVADDEAVNYPLDTKLSDVNGDIVISKGIKVKLTVDGKTKTVDTKVMTVEEFLKAQKITLGDDDRVTPEKKTKLTPDVEVIVQRVEVKTETVTEDIPYGTTTQYDSSLENGATQVKTEGVNGTKEVTYEITYVDGEEESRKALEETVIKEAVDEVVAYGTAAATTAEPTTAAPTETTAEPTTEPTTEPTEAPTEGTTARTVVSEEDFPDCDGSGSGYKILHYSDDTTEIVEY